MWLRNVFLVCSVVASVLGDGDIVTDARPGQEYVLYESTLGEGAEIQQRAIPIEDFVTSHKIPEGIAQPSEEDDEEAEIAMEVQLAKEVLQRAVENLDKRAEKKKAEQSKTVAQLSETHEDEYLKKSSAKGRAHVQVENLSNSGILSEDGIKKVELARMKVGGQSDYVIPGVQVSPENPTTMSPVLTTPRELRAFDFVPVNIIREDSKDAYTPYSDRQFRDLSDVSLVPAGSNSRIQIKKGPNGKDYEYEYVYYYYDEEDEGKGTSQTNAQETPAKSTPAPLPSSRRGATNTRNKYSSIERTTTVEPVSNEVIPSRTSSRNRQVADGETPEERFPSNTRFPPRSRSNHNTGTTEPSRARGNRPRPNLDLVDSSSFRTHQEGPEFPHDLPKGPLRFLGVTPNEETEEKPTLRGRTRPAKPAPVEEPAEEPAEEPVVSHRRRPTTAVPEVEAELSKGQPTVSPVEEKDDESEPTVPAVKLDLTTVDEDSASVESVSKEEDATETLTTEIPTTEDPSAMDKVALDLYAFLQQGQSNLIDASTADVDADDATTSIEDETETTDVPTTTEPATTTAEPTTTPATTTTTTTEPTTTTTTTTEPPTTTTPAPTGRGKFRRPGVSGGIGTRNRYRPSGSSSGSSTEAAPAAEQTPRTRGRFGSSTGGFKRPRPGQRQSAEQPAVEEDVQKQSGSSVSAERPSLPSRNRFRGAGSRTTTTATPAPVSTADDSSSSSRETTSSFARPALNRLNIGRKRGRTTTAAPVTSEEVEESEESAQSDSQEAVSTTTRPTPRARLPGTGPRPLRPGPRINLRARPGLTTTTTTAAPETPEVSAEEPAGAGTEEESHEAPAETSAPLPTTPESPLTRLRNRNRLQVRPKSPRVVAPPSPRRSPLLPRRKTTEAPVTEAISEEPSAEVSEEEAAPTEAALPETSTAASQKHEEVRGLGGLLAPRRRAPLRRPGQLVSKE